MNHNKLWKTLKEMGLPDHLTCLWETWMQVKKQQLDLDMKQQTDSKLGVHQDCILSPCLFNLYTKFFVARSCPIPCNPMNWTPQGSSALGDSPGKNTGVGCHFLLQGILQTQGLNPGLPHCRRISYCLSHQETLYAEYIMRNAGLDEAQAGIKIAGRNISNLRYADSTPLMAESK